METPWLAALEGASRGALSHLRSECTRFGITPRVLLDVAGGDVSGFIQELLALSEPPGQEELEALSELGRSASRLAALERRVRAGESHLDDAAVVAKRRRQAASGLPLEKEEAGASRPLPGLRPGGRSFAMDSGAGPSSLAEVDCKARDRWAQRFLEALRGANAPSLREGGDQHAHALALIGRSRPATVRLRVRAWEAYTRWLQLRRQHAWPESAGDLCDYVREMVDQHAPKSFGNHFDGACRWFMPRTGHLMAQTLLNDESFKRTMQWAETELDKAVIKTKKAPRILVVVIASMELYVSEAGHPRVLRMVAWTRLLKVYGSMRGDDAQRLRPADLQLRESGLVGRLTRTKTTGAGRRVRELPLYIPADAYIVNDKWLFDGKKLMDEFSKDQQDYLVPRPRAGLYGFLNKPATAGDVCVLGAALMSALRRHTRIPGGSGGSWGEAEATLIPAGLSGGWTNHSERSTLTSALAALGVDKPRRDMLGRWSPSGSDDYVRTHKVVVRELIGKLTAAIRSGRSYELLDEEDAIEDIRARVTNAGVDKGEVESMVKVFGGTVKEVSKSFIVQEAKGPPTEVASLASLSEVEVPGPEVDIDAKFLIVYTRARTCARLHLANGCWRARQMNFQDYEVIEDDHPPRDRYNEVCKECWPVKHLAPTTGAAGLPEGEPDDDAVGSTSSSSSTSAS